MAPIHVCVLASLLCIVASSPVTQDETEETNFDDVLKDFREELTELKKIITMFQQNGFAADDTVSTRSRGEYDRQRRSVDSPLIEYPSSFTNDSEALTVMDLSRVTMNNHSLHPAGGIVYTHWGRDDCSDGAELVYSGMTTGAHYSHTGGGVNYLCLPQEPIYEEVETTAHATRSLLYNAELETSTAQALQGLHDQTPACAICRAPPNHLTKLMIPGRNDCPNSRWRLEYKGYLMSSYHLHKTRTDFICMDQEAKAVPGTTGSQDGALFYMVEARCSPGGIQCEPYVNGYELTCAVCTI